MKHYLAVLAPLPDGSWRAHFPDFPGCRADGHSLEAATFASANSVINMACDLQRHGRALPVPQSFEDVRHHSNGWASERGIDWSTAVVSIIPLAVPE
jgi:predicted RNase H-like HicB family nuclease